MSIPLDDLESEIREKIPTCDDCGTPLVPDQESKHNCPRPRSR